MRFYPGVLAGFVLGIRLASYTPQMLASMIKIDNLNRAGEVVGGYHTGEELGAEVSGAAH